MTGALPVHLQTIIIGQRIDSLYTRYSILASAIFLVYDHFLTLSLEAQCFWNNRWGLGKILYLLTRYAGMAMVIGFVIIFNFEIPSEFCGFFIRIYIISVFVLVFLAGLILTARVYAAYNCNKFVLAISLFFCLASAVGSLLITYYFMPQAHSPGSHLPGCYFIKTSKIFATNAGPVLVNESIQILFMFYKAWQAYRDRWNSSTLHILIRDSFVFFVGAKFILLVNMLIWIFAPNSLSMISLSWLVAIRCSLTGRLLLNLRRKPTFTEDLEEWGLADYPERRITPVFQGQMQSFTTYAEQIITNRRPSTPSIYSVRSLDYPADMDKTYIGRRSPPNTASTSRISLHPPVIEQDILRGISEPLPQWNTLAASVRNRPQWEYL